MTNSGPPKGYTGRILRVNLSRETVSREEFSQDLRKYLGGAGMGIRILYDEVPPGVSWSDAENRLILASGPLNGSSIPGSGTICAVSKGCLTDGGSSSQANGYFGAFLKRAGLDALIIQGMARTWKYLHIHDGLAEIREADHLLGKNTDETGRKVKEEIRGKPGRISVYGIGPAGENLVKYAIIQGDGGHVMAHNGLGAVMGSKHLKAVAVESGNQRISAARPNELKALAKKIGEQAKIHPIYGRIHQYGTSMLWPVLVKSGLLPVRNLTTNFFPPYERFSREHYGRFYEMKRVGCWACPLHHVQRLKIKEGIKEVLETKDPEYECTASWSSLIGNEDFEKAVMLSDLADRLGLDSNEAGWTMAFVIECYEKGILTRKDTDGLAMTWGNTDAVQKMLLRIARRQGIGDLLAEGVMRAAEKIGGEATDLGVYVMKGHSPRTHDARARWGDILDYATGGVGTSESNSVVMEEPFLPKNVAMSVKKGKVRGFVDSLVVCAIATMTYAGSDVSHLVEALNLATGWDFGAEEAERLSERIANLFRAFNIRHGHTPALEKPSPRYGSIPVDGPMRGKDISASWEEILREYYGLMGWDRATGKPLPETLRKLGLEEEMDYLWRTPF